MVRTDLRRSLALRLFRLHEELYGNGKLMYVHITVKECEVVGQREKKKIIGGKKMEVERK